MSNIWTEIICNIWDSYKFIKYELLGQEQFATNKKYTFFQPEKQLEIECYLKSLYQSSRKIKYGWIECLISSQKEACLEKLFNCAVIKMASSGFNPLLLQTGKKSVHFLSSSIRHWKSFIKFCIFSNFWFAGIVDDIAVCRRRRLQQLPQNCGAESCFISVGFLVFLWT